MKATCAPHTPQKRDQASAIAKRAVNACLATAAVCRVCVSALRVARLRGLPGCAAVWLCCCSSGVRVGVMRACVCAELQEAAVPARQRARATAVARTSFRVVTTLTPTIHSVREPGGWRAHLLPSAAHTQARHTRHWSRESFAVAGLRGCGCGGLLWL